jgi:alpha-amylase/alpha-mannosidase (GH57 family)
MESFMGLQAFSVHAHFYQPPREDPVSGQIPLEASAAPYPNWNERIHAECYRPNAELRNFERISFNIGPTLFAWLSSYHPATARRIVEQDRLNVRRHGVGNALAQAYNHTILPLGAYPDKVTQVYWGMADFTAHFGRRPQGMWLPETAVDLETLDVMAQMGLQFTILAPWQAEGSVDATEPYIVRLHNGRQMTVFFYQQELSGAISFNPDLTTNADHFALNELSPRFNPEKTRRGEAQMMMIASDGELYGHHQFFRDRFLARLVDGATSSLDMNHTYPARWLLEHPARQVVGIREHTSWSCHHGVGRWTGECACTPGDRAWKQHLWRAMERLAKDLDMQFYDAARRWVCDPYRLRQRYIHVILGQMSLSALLAEEGAPNLTSDQQNRLRLWLESQRERQRMFTSCGWFFEDFDRIEPRNNLAYAAQAVRLAREAGGADLRDEVIAELAPVSSRRSGLRAIEVFNEFLG